jgi:alkylated DNA repair dioxygenase AlkB
MIILKNFIMAASTASSVSHPKITGLQLYYNFIDAQSEKCLVDYIMSQPWPETLAPNGTAMKRRTQHYGWRYVYVSGKVSEPAPPITNILESLRQSLVNTFGRPFDQMIINLYERNQGISSHIDNLAYGDTIITISLLADTVMTFSRYGEIVNVYLPRFSMAVMKDEARYLWYHSISSKVAPSHLPVADVSDPHYAGKVALRDKDWRRISITVRSTKTR